MSEDITTTTGCVQFDLGVCDAGRLRKLQERIAELEAALAPFAAIPETVLSEYPDTEELTAAHYWVVLGHPGKTSFTREDLRRAKTAARIHDDKEDDLQEKLEF